MKCIIFNSCEHGVSDRWSKVQGVILSFAVCAIKDVNFCKSVFVLHCRINEGNFVCSGRFVPTDQCQCQKVTCWITEI